MYLDDGTIFPIKVVFRNFILVWEVTHPIMPFYARHYYIFYAPKVYKIFGIFDFQNDVCRTSYSAKKSANIIKWLFSFLGLLMGNS